MSNTPSTIKTSGRTINPYLNLPLSINTHIDFGFSAPVNPMVRTQLTREVISALNTLYYTEVL
jgi:hypothetical protein